MAFNMFEMADPTPIDDCARKITNNLNCERCSNAEEYFQHIFKFVDVNQFTDEQTKVYITSMAVALRIKKSDVKIVRVASTTIRNIFRLKDYPTTQPGRYVPPSTIPYSHTVKIFTPVQYCKRVKHASKKGNNLNDFFTEAEVNEMQHFTNEHLYKKSKFMTLSSAPSPAGRPYSPSVYLTPEGYSIPYNDSDGIIEEDRYSELSSIVSSPSSSASPPPPIPPTSKLSYNRYLENKKFGKNEKKCYT